MSAKRNDAAKDGKKSQFVFQRPPGAREAAVLAMLRNGELYGREVRDAYALQTGQVMPLGSLYTTLDRMQAKGLVASQLVTSAVPGKRQRVGNGLKYFSVTARGVAALEFFEGWSETVANSRRSHS